MDRLMAAQQNLIPLIQASDAQGSGLARAYRGDGSLGTGIPPALPGICGS